MDGISTAIADAGARTPGGATLAGPDLFPGAAVLYGGGSELIKRNTAEDEQEPA
ncbi:MULTISPECIES: hypothetical protein [unclassified Pseudarthrobacter]|uniref:hypothetical protein n=1 Tax=unclassified Pseudarthrobacter TaxID=2647000 RepID=UPI00363D39F4